MSGIGFGSSKRLDMLICECELDGQQARRRTGQPAEDCTAIGPRVPHVVQVTCGVRPRALKQLSALARERHQRSRNSVRVKVFDEEPQIGGCRADDCIRSAAQSTTGLSWNALGAYGYFCCRRGIAGHTASRSGLSTSAVCRHPHTARRQRNVDRCFLQVKLGSVLFAARAYDPVGSLRLPSEGRLVNFYFLRAWVT